MSRLSVRLTKNMVNRYQSMRIQRVISLFFTVVTVLGTIFLAASLFLRFSDAMAQESRKNSEKVLSQVNLNLDSYLRRVMRVSDTIYYSILKNADLSELTEETLLSAMSLIYEENRDDLVSIAVFDEAGEVLAAVPLSTLKPSANPAESEWFRAATENVENLHFSKPHIQKLFYDPDSPYRWVVSLSRHVQLTRDGELTSGVLLVDMSFDGIGQVCRGVDPGNDGYIFLIDSNGEIIYHPRQQLIYAGLQEENNVQAAAYSDGSHAETFHGERRQVTVKTVGYTGWKLVGVMSAGTVWTGIDGMILFGITLLLFSVFLMAFLNFRISAYIADPIRRLEHDIKEIEAGRENVEIVEDGCYEIQQLSHSVRSMVSTMRHLMDDIIEQERQKRCNELAVLQSQINPHFLYNTLDSVIWMTESGRYQESIEMVTSLARFFRISLSKGHSIIPLTDELEHARHYMNIQKIRYKNAFDFSVTAQPGMEGLYALKLSVQPILENAIYHGISGLEEDGLITVEALRQGDMVLIRVTDNGAGMPPEVVETLLDENRPEIRTRGSGIGIRNVHQRIRLSFGPAYGLYVTSEPDEGTTVEIRLPAIDKEAADRYWKEESL